MVDVTQLSGEIPDTQAGKRLDQALAALFPEYSRSRLQSWIKAGEVTVNGASCSVRDKVRGGERVEILGTLPPETRCDAEDIPLDIVYQDDAVIVVNKPAGLVVHPAAGNPDGTMQNALLNFDAALEGLPRSGIVHRIDKMTTGLLVVARTLPAHTALVEQLQARLFLREYDAVVCGVVTAGGTIDAPIGRHPVDRKRQAVSERGKPAVTHYRVDSRYRGHSLLNVKLETGRTHQIRVHMAHAHHPLVGDPVYGGRFRNVRGASESLTTVLRGFRRQALHARLLGITHPSSGEAMQWSASMPDDMQVLVKALETDAGK